MQMGQDNQPGHRDNSEYEEEQSHHMQHQDKQSKTGQASTANKNKEITAYFSSLNKAQQAAQRISDHASQIRVDKVPTQKLRENLDSAQAGVSVVNIGAPAWLGLVFGLIVGAVLGLLIYSNRVAFPGSAQGLSAGSVAVSFLWAGVLGSIGWLIGALIHLLRTSRNEAGTELRAIVSEDARSEVENILFDAGAWNVLVAGEASYT